MQTTQINLRTLKAVALAASNEETHYYLNGVLVECRETTVTYVATDGSRMLVAQEDLPELEDGQERLTGKFIIHSDDIKACKVKGKSACALDCVTLEACGPQAAKGTLGSLIVTFIDGTYPDWHRVIPREQETLKEGAPIAQFNPLYVASFGKFAEMMGWPVSAPHIHHTGYRDPHAITFGGGRKAFGVLIPVQNEADTWAGAPNWLSAERVAPIPMAAE